MRTTIFKCDRCGAEDNNDKIDLQPVGIFVGSNPISWVEMTGGFFSCDWCKKCREEVGLPPREKIDKLNKTENYKALDKIKLMNSSRLEKIINIFKKRDK
jgi:hypothetical protein